VVIEYCLSGCAQKKNRRIAMRARLKFKGMAGRHFLWSIESAFFSAALCAPVSFQGLVKRIDHLAGIGGDGDDGAASQRSSPLEAMDAL
jgi:hypothetical protein